jgi:hypothetical protein
MYASPASLFCLPPPRRTVIRGENAPAGRGLRLVCSCGAGTPARAALARRGRLLERSCGAGTPSSDAPPGRGRPEVIVLRVLGALKGWVIQGASIPHRGAVAEVMRLRGGWCRGKSTYEVKLKIQKIMTFLGAISTKNKMCFWTLVLA